MFSHYSGIKEIEIILVILIELFGKTLKKNMSFYTVLIVNHIKPYFNT